MLAEVAVPLPIFRTFTYDVPDDLAERVAPGMRVLVPFARSERIGWIERLSEAGPTDRTRILSALLDTTPSVPPNLMQLCRWVADYYVAPLGQVVRAALPAALSSHSTDLLERLPDPDPVGELTELEAGILDWLAETDGPRPVARLRRDRGDRTWWPAIRRLEGRSQVRVVTEPPRQVPPVQIRRVIRISRELPSLRERDETFGRARRQRECWEWLESVGGVGEVAQLTGVHGFSYAVINGLVGKGVAAIEEQEVLRDPYAAAEFGPPSPVEPTAEQKHAIAELVTAARAERPPPFLLRGVTGSGKTLVYIELLREIVDVQGRTAIVLVPEIALTPQTVSRFKAVFHDKVAVLHSALSDGERYDEWRALRSGSKRIVVGARSAVFAPVPDLGAIIVDEEHETSYKQSDPPRYHAREVAIVRSAHEGAVCVLGSATPSLESWANAQSAKYRLLELPFRATGGPLPMTRVVDLREERKRRRAEGVQAPSDVVLSAELNDAVHNRLQRGEQTILLLNRRGYANFVQCRECGEVWDCPSCAVSLTYHRRLTRLTCHYCLHEEAKPVRCRRCDSSDLNFRGIGTEQVERTVGEIFPSARIARMDVDTTGAKWSHHRILEKVERGDIDILLGTQMIAKGLDFPNVTLVGVINADVGINLPDFRATERAFQLITQVAGRAGRGPKGGEVLVQTSLPRHYAITCSLEHDFSGFADRELEARRAPRYPPYVKLINLVFSGLEQAATEQEAHRAAGWLNELLRNRDVSGIELVGPAPCPIERIRDRWRWHLLIRSENARLLGRITRYFGERFRAKSGKEDLRVTIDRDPVSLL
ncbi:MAG: primosomal protein N' [Gemmatimonas sp.]|nr:primosomal protein N' [Gemmatimonas sp.]